MTLLPMTAAHLDAVMALDAATDPTPLSREQWQQELANPRMHCVVLEENGAPRGFACLWRLDREAAITRLGVAPAHQGKGLGKHLVAHLLGLCREAGHHAVTLEVRHTNATAIGLYRAFGFDETGRRPRYYRTGEDAVLMTLVITGQ